jgi:hypothetical protein
MPQIEYVVGRFVVFLEDTRDLPSMLNRTGQSRQADRVEGGQGKDEARTVEHEYTLNWAPILESLGTSNPFSPIEIAPNR